MIHMFDADIATKYGVNAAILLQNIYYWIEKNEANGKNFYDGYYWTYNSIKAFAEMFPYMSSKQVRTALENLINEGLLIKGNYNENPYDRTAWYAMTEKAYALFGKEKSNCHNKKIDLTCKANEFCGEGEPIPDNKPYINTNNIPPNPPLPERVWR